MATMIVLVGLPAAGKTTLARRLATEHRAVRLSPDELRVDISVVLDFGCWARAERSAARRWADTPEETFAISPADLDRWRALFEAPDAEELADGQPSDPPPSWSSWVDWAEDRWPSLSAC